jgi:ceramidase
MGTGIAVVRKSNLRSRWAVLAGIVVVACGVTAALKPIPQPAWYHKFADARTLLKVPNAENVLSNLPFVIVGLAGLYVSAQSGTHPARQQWTLLVLFIGLVLTGLGSGYYHLAPDNQRLFWDRLPMTIAMAGIVSFLFVNRVAQGGLWILPLLLIAGAGSVFQWSWSEQQGRGDLRWYLLFQALAFIVGVGLLALFPRGDVATRAAVIALLANIAAKLFELLDKPIYAMGGMVSGHALKHLSASLGFIPLVLWMASRENGAAKS